MNSYYVYCMWAVHLLLTVNFTSNRSNVCSSVVVVYRCSLTCVILQFAGAFSLTCGCSYIKSIKEKKKNYPHVFKYQYYCIISNIYTVVIKTHAFFLNLIKLLKHRSRLATLAGTLTPAYALCRSNFILRRPVWKRGALLCAAGGQKTINFCHKIVILYYTGCNEGFVLIGALRQRS